MPGYVIAELEVTDPVGFEDYRKAVPATIAVIDGELVAKALRPQTGKRE